MISKENSALEVICIQNACGQKKQYMNKLSSGKPNFVSPSVFFLVLQHPIHVSLSHKAASGVLVRLYSWEELCAIDADSSFLAEQGLPRGIGLGSVHSPWMDSHFSWIWYTGNLSRSLGSWVQDFLLKPKSMDPQVSYTKWYSICI